MTHLSLNELKFAVRWAALGVGAPPGLADDLAAAAVEVACLDVDPLALVIPVLDALPSDYVWGRLRLERSGDSLRLSGEGGRPSIVELGPAFADAALIDPGQVIETEAVPSPMLLAGYLENAGVRDAVLHGDGRRIVFDAGGGVAIEAASDEPNGAGGVRLEPGVDVSAPARVSATSLPAVERGVPVDDETWARMKALTARAWVKPTERSRLSGAGAGLVDRD